MPELHREVRTVSAETKSALESRFETVQHFQSLLDSVKKAEHRRFFAVTGEIDRNDEEPEPCVLVYDGSVKSCMMQLHRDDEGAIKTILITASDDHLERANPVEPGPKLARLIAPKPPMGRRTGETTDSLA